jgi:hypothetical protein
MFPVFALNQNVGSAISLSFSENGLSRLKRRRQRLFSHAGIDLIG